MRKPTLNSVKATVIGVLRDMGFRDAWQDPVIAASWLSDEKALIADPETLSRFIVECALRLGFAGYQTNEVTSLTVSQFCELYIRDSYPDFPVEPLSFNQYNLQKYSDPLDTAWGQCDFPICFVLGCPRSGTTLFRTMLNLHTDLWAPGELHLANFENMADRANRITPTLRYLSIPEVATRLKKPITSLSAKYKKWELTGLSIPSVYEILYDADPNTLIVDKTPAYSRRLDVLRRIGQHFPNAYFIHIVRNPHDVIRSFVKMQLYKGVQGSSVRDLNPYHIGELIWYTHNTNIVKFLQEIPDYRKCSLRYEDLVSNTVQSLSQACGLLNISYEDNMLNPYENASTTVAFGAGDTKINFLKRVENRLPSDRFYPIGDRCRSLAERFCY